MPLDMTGPARWERQVHSRRCRCRCLGNDLSRFVDLADFPTEAQAAFTPLRPQDVIDTAANNPGDHVAAGQAQRLLASIGSQWSAS